MELRRVKPRLSCSGLLETSVFIDRASFRSTSPCSEHRYLSSGSSFGLRKHRYLSIGRRFGPHRPARNIGIYRAGARSTFANEDIYRSGLVLVHVALLETSVFIERAPIRPSHTSMFIDLASFLSESACSILDRPSFRSTSPCSKHLYLSSGRRFDLRKRRNVVLYRAGVVSL